MQSLNLAGLTFTLIGACLLFFYGLPRKRIGNVLVVGDTAFKVSPEPNESSVPDGQWQSDASRFLARAKSLNMLGFALVALGTLLQMVAACLP